MQNQGKFYDWFDAVVLLIAPVDLILDRIARRATNNYSKAAAERELICITPRLSSLLRATCTHDTHEVDATRTLEEVVADLIAIASAA